VTLRPGEINRQTFRCFPSFQQGQLSFEQIAALVTATNLSGQNNQLIICIIWKESGFDPTVSNGKHIGLMEVGPGALSDVQKKASFGAGTGFANADLFDPATNISVGTYYLGLRFQGTGNLNQGLDAYGTGPGYSDNILDCEQCLLNQNKNRQCSDPQQCLDKIHS
jgi:hypothetical protein